MKVYKPAEYAQEVWGGTVTSKTVINWIRDGKHLKGITRVEKTPTGRYRLFADEAPKSNVSKLVEQMRVRAA